MTGTTDNYAMGRTSAETERLQLQGDVLAPHSAHLFRLAGITTGMRVLDVGCGAGDVSMLLAELVGPTGSVIGVDMNPAILDVARARTEAAGLATVSYVEADLADLRLDESVDALVGRLVLMHLKEPAAIVRALSRLVRSGGVVSFQDYNVSRCHAVPPIQLVTACTDWVVGAIRAAGGNPNMGEQVASVLLDAGLPVNGAASTIPAGPAESVLPRYVADTVRSVLPAVLKYGIATEAEVDIDTFADRLTQALKEAGATFWSPELAATWARMP